MNKPHPYCRVFALLLCILLLAAPASLAEAKSKSSSHSQESLTAGLVQFGKTVIESYNRCVIPNKKNKKVVKNSDGSYTAEYMEADPNTVTGSFKPSTLPPVKYIGYLRYTENRYVCTASTREEALKGPFRAVSKTTTELVKYLNGKWTY